MFNHQYDFDIEIPKEVITQEKHDKIFSELLENKVIIGFCGYAKSGKDTIAKTFVDKYGFHRVAFADNIKLEMNKHLKVAVSNSILALGTMKLISPIAIDFFTEDLEMKKILRPYIIWYGEKLREINGPYYWINQAFKIDASGHNNIVLSDVRRVKELDVFEWSNAFKNRSELSFASAGLAGLYPDTKTKSYSTLLFHVSQFHLTDGDVLTHECIRVAQEKWMFDHTFYIDPRIKASGFHRSKAVEHQINEVVKKFGIQKPDKTIDVLRQLSILDNKNI